MAREIRNHEPIKTKSLDQTSTDNLAIAVSNLFGAKVVSKTDFDKINQEKERLLKQTKDITKLQIQLFKTECKLRAFVRYHGKWKVTTKKFEQRLLKLNDENLYIDFTQYPEQVSENLKEAYKCYANGLSMSCYIMILRTIEIIVNLVYEKNNPIEIDKNGKPIFVSASIKLNWVKKAKMIGGADYQVAKSFIEARNDSVHELYVPTDKQILSAFETVIKLATQLKVNLV